MHPLKVLLTNERLCSYHPKNVVIVRHDNEIFSITFEMLFESLALANSVTKTLMMEEIDLTDVGVEILDGEVFVPLTRILRHKSHCNLVAIDTIDGASFVVTEDHPVLMLDGTEKTAIDVYIGDQISTYSDIEFLPMVDDNGRVGNNKTPLELYELFQSMTICNKLLLIEALNLSLECRIAILAGCMDNVELFDTVYDSQTGVAGLEFDHIGVIQQLYAIVKSLGYHEVMTHCYDGYKASLKFVVENSNICDYSKLVKEVQPLFITIHPPMVENVTRIAYIDEWVYDITTTTGTFYCSGMKANTCR